MKNPVEILHLDHLVLTVHNIQASVEFYTHVLGMREVRDGDRITLRFGHQQINLHEVGHERDPKALVPTPGSADLCFITTATPAQILTWLASCHIAIVAGPVERVGAHGVMVSVYVRDPDGNLLELAYLKP